jgi:hypothetical protein
VSRRIGAEAAIAVDAVCIGPNTGTIDRDCCTGAPKRNTPSFATIRPPAEGCDVAQKSASRRPGLAARGSPPGAQIVRPETWRVAAWALPRLSETGIEVAGETGLPVMAHLDNLPPSRWEVLARLRRGDILTYCFRPFPNAPVTEDGQIREEVFEARERGAIFDIGYGSGSFGSRTAEAMLNAGFCRMSSAAMCTR